VTRAYRLLVLGEAGTPVRELYVSRVALWAGAIGVLLGCTVVGGAGYALVSCRSSSLHRVAVARPTLQRSQVLKVDLTATRSPQSPELPKGPCGPNMILVEGNFCPVVFHHCQSHTDPEGNALHGQRCAEYKRPARCLSPQRQPLRYCIDRDEFVVAGETLPQNRQTFADARNACANLGKRLCSNVEWTFACEGESMNPYPYGFVRDSSACNADRDGLVTPEGELKDLRAPPGAFPRCQSTFGVRDLCGNVEEYAVEGSNGQPVRKGGYWQHGANHCRLAQPHADATYLGVEIGFRCCADAAPSTTG
jgi:formylglycine-generating enzyme